MRITGSRMMTLNATAYASQQEAVADASEQVTSGKRVNTPSDDPVAWAAAQRVNVRKLGVNGTTEAMQVARDRMFQTDDALAAIGDAVSQAYALAVEGNNDTQNATSRATLGGEVRALFDNALRAANTKGSNGEYLLAGANSLVQPFTSTGAYTGDATVRKLENGLTASLSGVALTAVYGVDVIPLLEQVAVALETNNKAAIQAALGDLDTAVKQVSTLRSTGGAAQSVLSSTLHANSVFDGTLTEEISRNVEVDAIEAATKLAKTSQALDATRTVSAKIVALLDPRNMGL